MHSSSSNTIISISVAENTKRNFETLHPAEQRVGSYILDNPEKVLEMNVADLAEAADTSSATVIRFCQKLNYKGYFQMKLKLSQDIAKRKFLNSSELKELPNSTAADISNIIINNISSIFRTTPEHVFQECAQAIQNSHTVFVIGNGYCKILAADIIYRLTRMGYRCAGGGYAETDFENLHLGEPGDVAIFISRSGEDRKTADEMEHANSQKMITISLTDAIKSPLSQSAKFSLITGVLKSDRISEEYTSSDIYLHVMVDILLQYISPRVDSFAYLDDVLASDRI